MAGCWRWAAAPATTALVSADRADVALNGPAADAARDHEVRRTRSASGDRALSHSATTGLLARGPGGSCRAPSARSDGGRWQPARRRAGRGRRGGGPGARRRRTRSTRRLAASRARRRTACRCRGTRCRRGRARGGIRWRAPPTVSSNGPDDAPRACRPRCPARPLGPAEDVRRRHLADALGRRAQALAELALHGALQGGEPVVAELAARRTTVAPLVAARCTRSATVATASGVVSTTSATRRSAGVSALRAASMTAATVISEVEYPLQWWARVKQEFRVWTSVSAIGSGVRPRFPRVRRSSRPHRPGPARCWVRSPPRVLAPSPDPGRADRHGRRAGAGRGRVRARPGADVRAGRQRAAPHPAAHPHG